MGLNSLIFYMIIKNILSENEKEEIVSYWENYTNKKQDHQAKGTLAARQVSFLNTYHSRIKSVLEKETGFSLSKKFNAIRLYIKGDKLEKHIDNAAPFAITIVVKQSDLKHNPLVFYFDNPQTIILQEGDGYYFKGMEIPHERLEVQSDYLLHIYLGYNIYTKTVI